MELVFYISVSVAHTNILISHICLLNARHLLKLMGNVRLFTVPGCEIRRSALLVKQGRGPKQGVQGRLNVQQSTTGCLPY